MGGDAGGLHVGFSRLLASQASLRSCMGAGMRVIANGTMFYTYLQSSMVILARVAVVTHAVGNSMRRPVVLICNVLYFRNEIGAANAFGICLAFGGVLLYKRAK